jgi:succinylarginine dihydrolase
MLDEAKAGRIEAVIAAHWPDTIALAEVGTPALAERVIAARMALLDALDLSALA